MATKQPQENSEPREKVCEELQLMATTQPQENPEPREKVCEEQHKDQQAAAVSENNPTAEDMEKAEQLWKQANDMMDAGSYLEAEEMVSRVCSVW